MRKTWKEAGLAALNLIAVVAVVIAGQVILPRYIPLMIGAPLIAACVVAVYLAASKWIEKRYPSEFDLHGFWKEVLAGFIVGFALFTATMTILWVLHVYRPAGRGDASLMWKELAFALGAGVLEETLFRGLLFRMSSKILGTWGALLLTSAFFGAAHSFNPGASISSSLAIMLEAGVLLGAAYAATGRLWVPIGLHIGWNFTEGSVFGMSISGTGEHPGLIRGSLSGPPLLTGGKFGPEASVVAVIACLIAAVYFIRRIVKQHRVEPPIWAQRAGAIPLA